MIREKYSDMVFACKVLAAMLETQVKIQEYPEYGWVSIVFQTDNFGGVYTILHYDLGTGELRKDYGTEKELDIDRLSALYKIVKEDMEKMLKARDMEAVSDFINSQYD